MTYLAFALLLTVADPLAFPKSIGKEPAYQTKSPKYGLLAFGPDATARVWVVLDGDTLYVDRNGNGDLTDPGEKIAANKGGSAEKGRSFEIEDLSVGGKKHLFHLHLRLSVPKLARFVDKAPRIAEVAGGDAGWADIAENNDIELVPIFLFGGK